jgi:hypothetical protein
VSLAVRSTGKLKDLLALIDAGAGDGGIYALALAAGRPYRRVHDQVRRLAAAGLIRVDRGQRGGRARIRVRSIQRGPALAFQRAWSRPSGGLDDETVIAQVLARPTFSDLLACVEHYGLDRVLSLRDLMLRDLELEPGVASASGRMLSNIEIGRARAAGSD